jgi:biopolymer transport protein ExbD
MAMMLPDGAGDDELMVELNTTPLIDVLLVLLVMLILSIPPQWHAVNMGLPVSAKPPDIKPQVIVLEILPGNGLRWNGQALAGHEELQAQMAQAAGQATAQVLHIRVHRQGPYSAVAHALSTAQRQGLKQVALLDGFD